MHFLMIAMKIFMAAVLLWFSVSPASGQTLFAAVGDYGDSSGDEGDVAGLVAGWNPDFVISLGDNRYGSTNFDQTVGGFYCNVLADAGSGSHCSGGDNPFNAFFPSLGNHDYTDGNGLNEYLNYFTLPGAGVTGSGTSGSERYYDFIMGPVHFFVVDSEGALISNSDRTAQMNWLQARLAASGSPWQVVYFHHPPYSSALHGSTPGMQWPFAAWGADAVLSGHDHSYERISADGIVYFVNGLGGRSLYAFNSPVPGSQVRYNSDYGAMRIDASDTAITFEFINVSGNVIDSYTLQAAAKAAPHAAFSSSCTNLSCDFTDSSTDSDGSVTGWSWDFGDGSRSSTQHPSHNYSAAGNYTVSLTVTDNEGASNGNSQLVSASAPNTVTVGGSDSGSGSGCTLGGNAVADPFLMLVLIGCIAGLIRLQYAARRWVMLLGILVNQQRVSLYCIVVTRGAQYPGLRSRPFMVAFSGPCRAWLRAGSYSRRLASL